LGFSEMLLTQSGLSDDTREFLGLINTGARDAAAVVARLREFYRPPTSGEIDESVSLGKLLTQIVDLTQAKWQDEVQRNGHKIEIELGLEDVRPVLADASQLREVFTNLIFNAVDAMPRGGRISLHLRGTPTVAVVEVVDTGSGMSEEVRVKCLEPFFTTKGDQGTGLGLSVCHGIIRRHGGKMEIDSTPGEGTTCRISLPFSDDRDACETDQPEVALPNRRVLYIDDDPRLRHVMSRMLVQLGQFVDIAEGGEKGLLVFQNNQYDLVITDLGMPEMSGTHVTETVKNLRPNMPVVMLTGWGSGLANLKPDENGAPDHILAKPVTLTELRDVLQKVLE